MSSRNHASAERYARTPRRQRTARGILLANNRTSASTSARRRSIPRARSQLRRGERFAQPVTSPPATCARRAPDVLPLTPACAQGCARRSHRGPSAGVAPNQRGGRISQVAFRRRAPLDSGCRRPRRPSAGRAATAWARSERLCASPPGALRRCARQRARSPRAAPTKPGRHKRPRSQ